MCYLVGLIEGCWWWGCGKKGVELGKRRQEEDIPLSASEKAREREEVVKVRKGEVVEVRRVVVVRRVRVKADMVVEVRWCCM